MALILNTGKTFNPSISDSYGIDMTGSDYYAVIDSTNYDKESKNCNFSVNVYGSEEIAANRKEIDGRLGTANVVDRINFNFNGDSFDESIGNDGITIPQAYALALADEQLSDWASDE